jgi:hypothetical protein
VLMGLHLHAGPSRNVCATRKLQLFRNSFILSEDITQVLMLFSLASSVIVISYIKSTFRKWFLIPSSGGHGMKIYLLCWGPWYSQCNTLTFIFNSHDHENACHTGSKSSSLISRDKNDNSANACGCAVCESAAKALREKAGVLP